MSDAIHIWQHCKDHAPLCKHLPLSLQGPDMYLHDECSARKQQQSYERCVQQGDAYCPLPFRIIFPRYQDETPKGPIPRQVRRSVLVLLLLLIRAQLIHFSLKVELCQQCLSAIHHAAQVITCVQA